MLLKIYLLTLGDVTHTQLTEFGGKVRREILFITGNKTIINKLIYVAELVSVWDYELCGSGFKYSFGCLVFHAKTYN